MKRWSGRVAVVTGANSGIGAAIAQELVKNGLKVVGLARRAEIIEDMAISLTSESGKLYGLKCDVTSETEVKKAFDWIKSNLTCIDVLVNNVGNSSPNTLIDGPSESWRQIYDRNIMATSICTKEAIQMMKEKGVDDGHIININSDLGHKIPPPEFGLAMYSSSKHALTALTEGLRRELVNMKSKIRVTSLSPGLVNTDAIPKETLRMIPHLQPEDLASAVVYILGTPPHVQIHELTFTHVNQGVV